MVGPQPAPPPRPPIERYGASSGHVLDRLAVVARYRRIASAVFVLTAGALMVQGYSKITVFQAQARLLIEDERSTAMPGITSPENMYWQDPEPYYNTQYRILRGRDLTRRVIKRINLKDASEFNGPPAPPSNPIVLTRQLAGKALALLRPASATPSEKVQPDENAEEASLVDAFLARV